MVADGKLDGKSVDGTWIEEVLGPMLEGGLLGVGEAVPSRASIQSTLFKPPFFSIIVPLFSV